MPKDKTFRKGDKVSVWDNRADWDDGRIRANVVAVVPAGKPASRFMTADDRAISARQRRFQNKSNIDRVLVRIGKWNSADRVFKCPRVPYVTLIKRAS